MMNDLATTAGRLREVREAQLRFLDLWALDEISAGAGLLDRVAADVGSSEACSAGVEPHRPQTGSDPFYTQAVAESRFVLNRRGIMDD